LTDLCGPNNHHDSCPVLSVKSSGLKSSEYLRKRRKFMKQRNITILSTTALFSFRILGLVLFYIQLVKLGLHRIIL